MANNLGRKPAGKDKRPSWEQIKAEYVSGDTTVRELAKRHGLSVYSVSDHCSKEGWVEARARYRDEVAREAVQEYRARDAGRIADELQSIREAAEAMSQAALLAAKDPQQYHRHLVMESDGKRGMRTVEKVFDKADARAMRDMAQAVSQLAQILRTVYGIPTYMEEQQIEQARARLELDRAKAQLAGDASDEGGVVVLADVQQEDDGSDDERH